LRAAMFSVRIDAFVPVSTRNAVICASLVDFEMSKGGSK
jgi:hypothetical protein